MYCLFLRHWGAALDVMTEHHGDIMICKKTFLKDWRLKSCTFLLPYPKAQMPKSYTLYFDSYILQDLDIQSLGILKIISFGLEAQTLRWGASDPMHFYCRAALTPRGLDSFLCISAFLQW